MHAFLCRHLPRPWANLLALLWYAFLVGGVLLCWQRDPVGFIYLRL
jgi:hypothetical protein